MTDQVDRIIEIANEVLRSPMKKVGKLLTEQRKILSEVSIEEFEEALSRRLPIKVGYKKVTLDSLNERCGICGNRRGGHFSGARTGCSIGSDRHNRHYNRQDPQCNCPGFMAVADYEQAEQEQAEEDAVRATWPWQCEGCEEIFEDNGDFQRLYECGECGSIFSYEDVGSHRCEQCGKFAAKLTENGCPECQQSEVIEREVQNA